MTVLAAIFGIIALLIILWDGFEVIILPRRVARKLRLSRLFYLFTWTICSWVARRMRPGRRRERYLSFYGPLSLLFLIVVWAVGMILAFALVQWAAGPPKMSFYESVYLSGTTFITLGMGVPHTRMARAVLMLEAGVGFGFLAMVISYLPVLYQSFAQRETSILLLDARAGSPPTAAELLRRYATGHGLAALNDLLREWEIWSADLLETYISYPVLAYFRSQHDNQSWLAALTARSARDRRRRRRRRPGSHNPTSGVASRRRARRSRIACPRRRCSNSKRGWRRPESRPPTPRNSTPSWRRRDAFTSLTCSRWRSGSF